MRSWVQRRRGWVKVQLSTTATGILTVCDKNLFMSMEFMWTQLGVELHEKATNKEKQGVVPHSWTFNVLSEPILPFICRIFQNKKIIQDGLGGLWLGKDRVFEASETSLLHFPWRIYALQCTGQAWKSNAFMNLTPIEMAEFDKRLWRTFMNTSNRSCLCSILREVFPPHFSRLINIPSQNS